MNPGEWEVPPIPNWPSGDHRHYAIHMIHLPTDEIMVWGRRTTEELVVGVRCHLWDRAENTVTQVIHEQADIFCAGHAQMDDGRILAAGGGYPGSLPLTPRETARFDRSPDQWMLLPHAHFGRWYPTLTTLPDSRVMMFAGQIELISGMSNVNATIPEYYDPAHNLWVLMHEPERTRRSRRESSNTGRTSRLGRLETGLHRAPKSGTKARTKGGIMNTARTVALLMLSLPAAAAAQTIFHDDFSGKALAPHWWASDPWNWNHQVANGLLTVDWILPPDPQSFAHNGSIRTEFSPHLGDFAMTVRAGWEPGEHRGFQIQLTDPGPTTRLIGQFLYTEPEGMAPNLRIHAGIGQPQNLPAPGPGMHEFTFVRTGSQADFYLNQQHIATLPTSELPLGQVGFDFILEYPGEQFPAMYVDFVTIVPSPAGLWVLFLGASAVRRRRRP